MRWLPTRTRRWLDHVLYGELAQEWPHDPLNNVILLACFYVILPVGSAVGAALHLTGWIHAIPIWLSLPPFVYVAIATWVAHDEWRSRSRSDGGHGWIWQVVEEYWPRQRFNQLIIAVICVANAGGAILQYIDRSVTSDLERAEALHIVEAASVIAADWLVHALWKRWVHTDSGLTSLSLTGESLPPWW